MILSVPVYSDYVCPYCFLVEGPLYEAVENVSRDSGVNIEVDWMPFELRPEPNPTLRPEGDYLQTGWARSVYPLARQLRVEITLPSVSPQPYSRLAFEGSLFARQHGKLREYNHAVFCAFFQEDKDIGRIDVLREVAEGIGLDGNEFAGALENGVYRDEHAKLLRHAVEEMGIRSVPAAFIGTIPLMGVRRREEYEAVLRPACGRSVA